MPTSMYIECLGIKTRVTFGANDARYNDNEQPPQPPSLPPSPSQASAQVRGPRPVAFTFPNSTCRAHTNGEVILNPGKQRR